MLCSRRSSCTDAADQTDAHDARVNAMSELVSFDGPQPTSSEFGEARARPPAATRSAEIGFIERRAAVRVPTHFAARLCYGPRHGQWADCVVKDLSTGGAKVELCSMYQLPRAFVLLHFSAGLAFEAVRRWRRADLLGVSFETCHDLNAPLPPRLARVQATWLALQR